MATHACVKDSVSSQKELKLYNFTNIHLYKNIAVENH